MYIYTLATQTVVCIYIFWIIYIYISGHTLTSHVFLVCIYTHIYISCSGGGQPRYITDPSPPRYIVAN